MKCNFITSITCDVDDSFSTFTIVCHIIILMYKNISFDRYFSITMTLDKLYFYDTTDRAALICCHIWQAYVYEPWRLFEVNWLNSPENRSILLARMGSYKIGIAHRKEGNGRPGQ